jgi:hypothetical protein
MIIILTDLMELGIMRPPIFRCFLIINFRSAHLMSNTLFKNNNNPEIHAALGALGWHLQYCKTEIESAGGSSDLRGEGLRRIMGLMGALSRLRGSISRGKAEALRRANQFYPRLIELYRAGHSVKDRNLAERIHVSVEAISFNIRRLCNLITSTKALTSDKIIEPVIQTESSKEYWRREAKREQERMAREEPERRAREAAAEEARRAAAEKAEHEEKIKQERMAAEAQAEKERVEIIAGKLKIAEEKFSNSEILNEEEKELLATLESGKGTFQGFVNSAIIKLNLLKLSPEAKSLNKLAAMLESGGRNNEEASTVRPIFLQFVRDLFHADSPDSQIGLAQAFKQACDKQLLPSKGSRIAKAVAIVAIAITVAAITLSLSCLIGMAVGAWAGPAAMAVVFAGIFSGTITAASTAAIVTPVAACITGSISAFISNSLFNQKKISRLELSIADTAKTFSPQSTS